MTKGGLKAEPNEKVGHCGRRPESDIAGSEAAGDTESQTGEGIPPLTEAELRSEPKSRVELGYWHGKGGGARGEHLLFLRHQRTQPEGSFRGLSNCPQFRSPLPAAVTPRFSARPPGSAQVRWIGAGRAAGTGRGGAGRANQRIYFRVAWAPFCGEGYKRAARKPLARLLLCCRRQLVSSARVVWSGLSETFPRGSQLPELRRGVEPS